MHGLPPEAAAWREQERWTTQDELMAVLVEQQGQWFRALFAAVRGQKRIHVPGVVEVPRPGQEARPKGRIVTDPGELRRWFSKNR